MDRLIARDMGCSRQLPVNVGQPLELHAITLQFLGKDFTLEWYPVHLSLER
jgi:hypothetical protein